jgi:hypothetical protein
MPGVLEFGSFETTHDGKGSACGRQTGKKIRKQGRRATTEFTTVNAPLSLLVSDMGLFCDFGVIAGY